MRSARRVQLHIRNIVRARRPARILATPLIRTCTSASFPYGKPSGRLLRLDKPAQLFTDTDEHEVLAEVPDGEFVEAFGDTESEWLLVRRSLEDDNIDVMSDSPLRYQDGWLHHADLSVTEHQIGDRVTARTQFPEHPLLDLAKALPHWKGNAPGWLYASVAEMHTGKIGGILQGGRYLVQRPSGAIPERIAQEPELLITPRERAKRTTIAGLLGFLVATTVGTCAHARCWARGESSEHGRSAAILLLGWLTVSVVFVTPGTLFPAFLLAVSPLTSFNSALLLNLLLYVDLMGE